MRKLHLNRFLFNQSAWEVPMITNDAVKERRHRNAGLHQLKDGFISNRSIKSQVGVKALANRVRRLISSRRLEIPWLRL